MKKKALSLIIGLMSLSMLGLIGLQAYWVRHAMQVKEEQFDRSVNDALNQVVHQLEVREMANGLQKTIAAAQKIQSEAEIKQVEENKQIALIRLGKATQKITQPQPEKLKKVIVTNASPVLPKHVLVTDATIKPRLPQESRVVYRNNHPETDIKMFRYSPAEEQLIWQMRQQTRPEISVLKVDSLRKKAIFRQANIQANMDSMVLVRLHADSVFKRLNTINLTEIRETGLFRFPDSVAFHRMLTPTRKFTIKTDTLVIKKNKAPKPEILKPVMQPVLVNEEVIKRKETQVNQVVEKMVMEMVTKELPLNQRLNFTEVDSLVAQALADKQIELPYAVAVASNKTGSVLHLKQVNTTFVPGQPNYKVSLFPNDLVKKPDYLLLQFPDKKQYVLGSMWTMLSASAAFTLIMMLTFGATLGFIFRQKKISEIKSDFINNMTHEFKTPIATISLATDAINSPKVLADTNRINYYTTIIQQENKRMLSQVENVLQMALLDRQDLKLNFEAVKLDELLEQAIDKLKLQIESRQGTLNFISETAGINVFADKLHLENIFLNLLDNAYKYSPEAPEITVQTHQKNDKVFVTVTDRGIGMSAEEQKRVFDKFYRVPTGNLHNVKGFGLGLAYVKAMVEQHKGHITLKSSPNKGSSFEICLPVYKA